MKRLLILFPFMISTHLSMAQFNLGFTGGLTINNLNFKSEYYLSEEFGLGWHGGIFARFDVWKLYFQPEVLISQRNGTYTFSPNPLIDTIFNTNQLYLDIPLQVGINLFNTLRLSTGPVYSKLLKESVTFQAGESGSRVLLNEDVMEGYTLGWISSATLDSGKFFIGLSMQNEFGNSFVPYMIPGSGTLFNAEATQTIYQVFCGIKLIPEN